jgi:DNA repair exonuclease SbcCD ATPase subunit/predicted MPP superfamily phosphohydrolase
MKDTIPVKFDELRTIYHTADIHIRNVRRHKEYRQVFERLYEEVRKDTEDAVIVVAGDIVHAKLEMSPELVDLTFELFTKLANILPTIIITGNHDCNLNNLSRMDTLTAIVKNINNENLFYLKHSGVYDVANTKFVVMSVFDQVGNFIKSDQVAGDTKIALYHGTIHHAVADTGWLLHNDKVKQDLFKGYDIVLLGDIHKYQYMNKQKTIAFPGSLIQQNHGEDDNKGLLKWNVSTRKAEFIKLRNDYGYRTLMIDKGLMPDIQGLPDKARLRLKIKDTLTARVTEILTEIRKQYPHIHEVSEVKIHDLVNQNGSSVLKKINIGDVRDVNFQNTLIMEFLAKSHLLEESIISKIFEINTDLNSKLPPREYARNIIWKPQKFAFSNLFSFGENNKIDFSDLKGVVGLFAPNAYGKSNFVESLAFTIFDKSPRAWKAINALNSRKDYFDSNFEFEIDDKIFRIKRKATTNKKGAVNVKTDFSVKLLSGERKSLNGDRRSSTNQQIKSYVGDYDDFQFTALIPQFISNNKNFTTMKQASRKEHLARFLDFTVFQQLYDLAFDDVRDTNAVLREFERREFSRELASAELSLKKHSKEYKERTARKKEYEKLHKQINSEVKKLTSKLVKFDSITDIDGLKEKQLQLENDIKNYKNEILEITKYVNNHKSLQEKHGNELKLIDKDIEEKYQLITEIEKHRDEAKHDFDKYKIKVESKTKQLGDFAKIKYNDDCSVCGDNKIFVSSKLEEDDLEENKMIMKTFEDKINEFEGMLKKGENMKSQYAHFIDLKEKINELIRVISQDEKVKWSSESSLKEAKGEIKEVGRSVKLYEKNEKTIKKNREIQVKIDDWENKLEVVENGIEEISQEIMDIHAKIKVNEDQKVKINKEIDYVKDLEQKSLAYKYYMEAVERDGVALDLMESILAQMVNFRVILGVDIEDKDIYGKIVYNEDEVWPIELISGMERFIVNVAIRVALIGVSSLPRPNFLIIDEGFGSLDSENANNLYQLFDYLCTQFDFIVIISHLDYVRDMVNSIIEIKKENGFSKIVD